MVVSPTYTMLADSSLRSFMDHLAFLGRPFREMKSRNAVELANGATIFFRSADNPERLRGPNLTGIWMDEASLMDIEAYTICIASLREAGDAGWLTATFTPKGMSHWTYDVFATGGENVSLVRSSTSGNPFLSDVFVEGLKSQYSDRTALQEMGGEFVDAEGAEWPNSHFGPHAWWTGSWPTGALKVISVDPSKGSGSKTGDYSAVIRLSRGIDGLLYVQADMLRCNSEILTDLIIERQREFRADAIAIEANQFQELLVTQVAEKARVSGFPVPVVPIGNYVNKQVRIRRLGPYLNQHLFRFKAECPQTKILVEQLRDFPICGHDDGPDSLELGLRCMIDLYNGKARQPVAKRLKA